MSSPTHQPNTSPARYEDLAIAGFITAFLVPVVGMTLSVKGLKATRKNRTRGRGLAIAGIWVSVVGTAVIAFAGAFAVLSGLFGAPGEASAQDGTVTVADPSAQETEYLDGLYGDTRDTFGDGALLMMGHGYCTDLGASNQDLAAGILTGEGDLHKIAGMTSDDASRIEYGATHELCTQYGDGYDTWLNSTVPTDT